MIKVDRWRHWYRRRRMQELDVGLLCRARATEARWRLTLSALLLGEVEHLRAQRTNLFFLAFVLQTMS